MQPVKITDNIYWVGGIDWHLRNFHGYVTQRGSTYNAYLIIDEKITLIDTAKYYLVDELLERVSKIIDPKKIDILISNHVEMDHSGGLPRLKELLPQAKIYTSPNGAKGLKAHYKKDWDFEIVKNGDSLNTGKYNFSFLLTPMVHWPDNMVTYLNEEKILFSNDSFGQHIASSERFDDEYPWNIIVEEAKKYYANIVLPYSKQVQVELEAASKLDIRTICPSHGIIFRKHVSDIVNEYKKWSLNQTTKKALIIFDTMWHSTEMMARAIQDAFENKGYQTRFLRLQESHISDIMTELMEAEYICVGSPTLNSNILPSVSAFLTYLKGLAPTGRKGLAFGSYGWGGQSIKQVEDILIEIGFTLLPSQKFQYIPEKNDLEKITATIEELI